MKFAGKLFAILTICFSTGGFSQQNLVDNPSFELYNRLPISIGDAPGSITYWSFAGERGSGDYYHANSPGIAYRTIDNYFGSEEPHTGSAYAGFCVTPEYREFLSSALLTKLVKGKKYKFTMYISKGDNEEVSYLKEISVMFLSRAWVLKDDLVMGLPPQIVFYQDTGFTQSNGWQELTAVYTATGTEQWIYIGAHQWKCDTCKSVPGGPRTESPGIFGHKDHRAHYFVDDVSLVELSSDATPTDAPKTFETGKSYVFNNILFEVDSDELKESSYAVIDTIVDYMRANPNVKVLIIGYTDSTGDWHDNLKLSERRAQAVKDDMVYRGKIPSSRISAIGLGQSKPVAPNSTPEGRALNRRVEFFFSSAD